MHKEEAKKSSSEVLRAENQKATQQACAHRAAAEYTEMGGEF